MTECHTEYLVWVGKRGRRGDVYRCFKIASGTQSPPPPQPTSLSTIVITSSFTRFARSATSPSFTYVSNLVLDSSLCRAAAPQLRPLQLLLPDCICFSCCSPIASASTAAPRLRPLQLLLSICVRFGCCSPDCVRFDCCSPIACIRLQPQLDSNPCPHPGPMFSNFLRGVRGSVN